MSSAESPVIRFLYHTHAGRCLLKILVRPQFSELACKYLSSPLSVWLIDFYIKKHQINMSEYPKEKYRSFNDFFIRKRCLSVPENTDNFLVSPCDGYLSVHQISSQNTFRIKHAEYNLDSLLNDPRLAEQYQDGYCLIFRLAPHNYHRYIFIDDGEILQTQAIPGILHCVRPYVCTDFPVYIQNSREYTLLKSENFGNLVQMEVGALLVGRIKNHFSSGHVCKFTEKGYFEFGGSTIILLIEKDKIAFSPSIARQTLNNREVPVRSGQILADKL